MKELALYVASWLATIGGIWTLFARSETVASVEAKAAISRWLRNLDLTAAFPNWPNMFVAVFDEVFGHRHLSWQCFLRACIASLVSIAVLAITWAAVRPHDVYSIGVNPPLLALSYYAVLIVLLNLLPDYFSLLETRCLLRWMSKTNSVLRLSSLLVVDLAATSAISLAGMWIVQSLIRTIQSREVNLWPVRELFYVLWREILPLRFAGIFFYAAFFTSVWLWLYVLSGEVMRLGVFLNAGIHRLKWFLNIDEKPIRSLGFVAMLVASIAYLIWGIIKWFS